MFLWQVRSNQLVSLEGRPDKAVLPVGHQHKGTHVTVTHEPVWFVSNSPAELTRVTYCNRLRLLLIFPDGTKAESTKGVGNCPSVTRILKTAQIM